MVKKKALIFGISGQDGAYLARFLLEQGYLVYGVSRDAEISPFLSLSVLGLKERITFHSASLSDFRSTLQVISKVQPDEIYNLSGQSSVSLSFDQPVETLESIAVGTLNILESIRFLGGHIRFYNAGSSECFGDTFGLPASESTPFRPKSPYGVAKSTAFWQVANYRDSYGLYACSGILFNHESLLRPTRFVTRKVATVAARIAFGSNEKLIMGDLSIERDWGWAPEYVEAMWRMLQHETPDDFVVATGRSHSLELFVHFIFISLGLDWKKYVIQDQSLFRPSEIHSSLGCADKAATVLGWSAKVQLKDIAKRMAIGELRRLQGIPLNEIIC